MTKERENSKQWTGQSAANAVPATHINVTCDQFTCQHVTNHQKKAMTKFNIYWKFKDIVKQGCLGCCLMGSGVLVYIIFSMLPGKGGIREN